ncbi:hypothetical protein [Pseudomonas helleri]|uniref:Uncharacterized protein n=1 Tax=Pseudomonas helleri TaxID=1608996 RepID=A0A6L5HXG6_9PSED|nr:hypothetical protein [Pseudomonas helleri]MQU07748.1 hypothetical protein [Pseudomonas helleri]
MSKSNLALGLIAAIISVSSVHAIADEALEQSSTSNSTFNYVVEENKAQQDVFLEHVTSVVGEPVYQNEQTGVTVYSAPEPAPITVNY